MEYKIEECYPSKEEVERLANLMASEGWRFRSILSADLAKNNLWMVVLFERENSPYLRGYQNSQADEEKERIRQGIPPFPSRTMSI